MSEPVKIAEDLQDMYKATKLGTIMFAVGSQIRESIERVSAAEAALALAKEENARLKATVDSRNSLLNKFDASNERLNMELARLKARSKAPDGAQEAEGARDE